MREQIIVCNRYYNNTDGEDININILLYIISQIKTHRRDRGWSGFQHGSDEIKHCMYCAQGDLCNRNKKKIADCDTPVSNKESFINDYTIR